MLVDPGPARTEAQAQVKKAIGQSIKFRVVGPDETERAKVFVSTVAALPAQSALSEMLTGNLPIVLLARGSSMLPPLVLQRLAQLWRVANPAVEPLLADTASLRRVLLAMARNAETKLIAMATLEGDELVG
ncbi:MAG TPA: hypothetical protein VJU61_16955 [Polyangiaceae bacterium]|nr:hypothetical protein [Polyangiaceae bacterium]